MTLKELLEYNLIPIRDYEITPIHLFQAFLVVFAGWIMLFLSRKIIQRQIKSGRFDEGRGKAFSQILKYFIVIITILLGLDLVGIKLTILLAGSAALLVGIGLGLQQIFNDIVSGILLLFEGTVTVGDVVELNSVVGKVQDISIRTSTIETRDKIIIIVPNSKLISDNVINWSHNRTITRFNIKVGVAYGSDVPLVMRLLKEAAIGHTRVSKIPAPDVRFIDFGESSLDFELLFFSETMFEIEFVRSDIRVTIDQKFRDHNISIPFPQRDLHIKTDTPLTK